MLTNVKRILEDKIDKKTEISELFLKEKYGDEKVLKFYMELKKRVEKELGDEKIPSTLDEVTELFFPEIKYKLSDVDELRGRRRLKIDKLNENPIGNPFKEILFTSNILLTTPMNIDNIKSEKLKEYLIKNREEKQIAWFDHPIPLDISDEANEILYGLEKLNEAVKLEEGEAIDIALSVTTTHRHLDYIAREYIEELLKGRDLDKLNVYIFTEDDCKNIIDTFNLVLEKKEKITKVFGVSGNYGRHYSFLKAILALWEIKAPRKRATFKIDLDQVFPQNELLINCKKMAFENFKSPLWGAKAIDTNNTKVDLGMIAGALVNESDIDKSLFTPDVPYPQGEPKLDEFIFSQQKVQNISTISEMGTRYEKEDEVIKRYHVTGGTNGILLDSLQKYRPFTPTYISRAEDQAYLLSVIADEKESMYLRYYHSDGLIMRHDKDAFAGEAIKHATVGRLIGDYERVLFFSYYGKEIIGEMQWLKEELAPFTSAFISENPYSVIYFRSHLKAMELEKESPEDAKLFLKELSKRVGLVLRNLDEDFYLKEYKLEKQAWNLYYDSIENSLLDREKLIDTLKNCKIKG